MPPYERVWTAVFGSDGSFVVAAHKQFVERYRIEDHGLQLSTETQLRREQWDDAFRFLVEGGQLTVTLPNCAIDVRLSRNTRANPGSGSVVGVWLIHNELGEIVQRCGQLAVFSNFDTVEFTASGQALFRSSPPSVTRGLYRIVNGALLLQPEGKKAFDSKARFNSGVLKLRVERGAWPIEFKQLLGSQYQP